MADSPRGEQVDKYRVAKVCGCGEIRFKEPKSA